MKFFLLKQYVGFLFILSFVGFWEIVSAETKTSTIGSDLPHAVFKRQVPTTQRVQDHEVYYQIQMTTSASMLASNAKVFDDAFSNPNTTVTKTFMNSNGTWDDITKIQLKFMFYFYGHPVSLIGVSSSGYIKILEAGHEQTNNTWYYNATQYIAPLMGLYKTETNDTAAVSYSSKNDSVWIRWSNMTLTGMASNITFEAVIFRNNSMIFHYFDVSKLPDNLHVISGLADVFSYNEKLDEFLVHKVTPIPRENIAKNSMALITALPNCGQLRTCTQCKMRHQPLLDFNFSCNWCFQRALCGSATVQSLQSWKQYPCNSPTGAEDCHSGFPEDKAATVILGFFLAIFLAIIIAFVVTLCIYAHRVPDSYIGQCFSKTRLRLRERFLGLRMPSVVYRTSGSQVRLQEENDYATPS